jgi:hypothetical protein
MVSSEAVRHKPQGEKPAVEEVTDPSTGAIASGLAKQTKVQSVELADAIAKDAPNYWSSSHLQLYGIMLFATMSINCHPKPCAVALSDG